MTRRIGWLAGALLLALGTACRGSKSDQAVATTTDEGTAVSPSGKDAAKAGRSMVRMIDATPSSADLELTGDERTLFSAVKYKTVTEYAQVSDNLIAFKLRRPGVDTAVADDHEMLKDGARYSVVALPGKKSGELQLKVLTDEVAPAAGKARVRVINAAPTARNVDVAIQGQKDALFQGVDFGDAPGAIDIDPATATLEIRRDTKGTRPVLVRDVHLDAGKSTTIVITGTSSGHLDAFTFTDAPVQ